MINLFYQEPDYDRWVLYDRFPRRFVRRLIRGKPRISGHRRVALNLYAGLDRLGVRYRINDFRFARKNPGEMICIIGGPFMADDYRWENPVLFGAAVHSHPLESPRLFERLQIKKILVPGQWMADMCRPYWGDAVCAWPVGIDTDCWQSASHLTKKFDVLVYDKVRWKHELFNESLIKPILFYLNGKGLCVKVIRYGSYREEDFQRLLGHSRSMLFLCEHETQGIAYQQALACDVPILAWDRGGYWQDPAYYPDLVQYAPVTSVPYWDARCGEKFSEHAEFECVWDTFWESVNNNRYSPRDYIMENLTLEKCARQYLDIYENSRSH